MALAARTPEPQNRLRLVPGGAEEREPDSGPAVSGRVRAFDAPSWRAQEEVLDESDLSAGFPSGVGLRVPGAASSAEEEFDRSS